MVDSEHLVRRLKAAGNSMVEGPEEADALLVNTCGFIEEAKKESVNEILSLSKYKENGKELLVFGCLAQRYKNDLVKEIPEIDSIWGVDAEENIARHLGENGNRGTAEIELPATFPYAYLKIAEGCKRKCAFCSIPAIRGPLASFPPEEILQEAEAYIQLGIKELIIVSQDTASYNYKGYGIARLLKDISSLKGDFWLRVHYLYPSAIDDGLMETFAGEEKVVKYMDIPLQHSEDRILRLMGRGGGGDPRKLITRLRRGIPGAAIRTAFIVGFPGETEEDFRALRDFVEEAQFEHMGAFMYSKEEGTRAASYKGQMPKSVKKRRYEELMQAQAAISLERNKALIGRKLKTLVEDDSDPKIKIGRLYSQAPEIDGVVFVQGGSLKKGDFADVLITEAYDYDLKGDAC